MESHRKTSILICFSRYGFFFFFSWQSHNFRFNANTSRVFLTFLPNSISFLFLILLFSFHFSYFYIYNIRNLVSTSSLVVVYKFFSVKSCNYYPMWKPWTECCATRIRLIQRRKHQILRTEMKKFQELMAFKERKNNFK